MPAPPDPPIHWYGLSKFQSRVAQPAVPFTSAQSSFLICPHTSAHSPAVLPGLASHAYDASSRDLSPAALLASASFAPRFSKTRLRSPVVARLTASTSDGSVASASPAIARSTSTNR